MTTEHTILLNDYEVANLRAALEAIGYPWPGESGRSPLWALNSGDWVGQIYQKLPVVKHLPNKTPAQYAEDARNYNR